MQSRVSFCRCVFIGTERAEEQGIDGYENPSDRNANGRCRQVGIAPPTRPLPPLHLTVVRVGDRPGQQQPVAPASAQGKRAEHHGIDALHERGTRSRERSSGVLVIKAEGVLRRLVLENVLICNRITRERIGR